MWAVKAAIAIDLLRLLQEALRAAITADMIWNNQSTYSLVV